MPSKRASAAKRPDLSAKGGGAYRSPEPGPGLAAKAKAELEAATLHALHHQEEAGDDGAQANDRNGGAQPLTSGIVTRQA